MTPRCNKRKDGAELCFITDGINPDDVLFGQGGESNKNEGNARYRALIERGRPSYATASVATKTSMAQNVVNKIADQGGRFLKKHTPTQQWYLADERTARKKVSQALREKHITPEARAAKRNKYPKKTKAGCCKKKKTTTARASALQ